MSLPEVLGIAYASVTVLVVGFQVALALGAPWGRYAMGGAFPGRMPPALRIAALAQGIALAALAMIVIADAGLADVAIVDDWPWLIWVPVAVSAVAVVLNASTRSQGERRIWLPVAMLLLICSLGVALA